MLLSRKKGGKVVYCELGDVDNRINDRLGDFGNVDIWKGDAKDDDDVVVNNVGDNGDVGGVDDLSKEGEDGEEMVNPNVGVGGEMGRKDVSGRDLGDRDRGRSNGFGLGLNVCDFNSKVGCARNRNARNFSIPFFFLRLFLGVFFPDKEEKTKREKKRLEERKERKDCFFWRSFYSQHTKKKGCGDVFLICVCQCLFPFGLLLVLLLRILQKEKKWDRKEKGKKKEKSKQQASLRLTIVLILHVRKRLSLWNVQKIPILVRLKHHAQPFISI